MDPWLSSLREDLKQRGFFVKKILMLVKNWRTSGSLSRCSDHPDAITARERDIKPLVAEKPRDAVTAPRKVTA